MQTPRLILVATVGVLLALSLSGADAWILPSVIDSLGKLVNDVVAGVGGVVKNLSILIDGIVGSTADIVGNIINGILSPVRDLIQNLQNLSNKFSGEAKNNITNAINAFNDTAIKATDKLSKISSALDSTLQNVATAINDKLNSTAQNLTKIGINADKCFADIGKNITSILQKLAITKINFVESAGQIIMSALNTTATNVTGVASALSACIENNNIAICLYDALRPIVQATSDVDKAVNNLTGQTEQMQSNYISVGNEILTAIQKRAEECIRNPTLYKP